MSSLNYPLRTSRLTLRPLTEADVPALLRYRGDPDVCRYLPFEPMTEDVLRTRLRADLGRDTLPGEGEGLTLGVVTSSGQLVGDVVLFNTSVAHRQGEVGYVFDPAAGGQGYATEAAAAMLDLAFDPAGLNAHRVSARLDVRNDASARLLQRLGFRSEALHREAVLKGGEWADMAIYAILASEWAARR